MMTKERKTPKDLAFQEGREICAKGYSKAE
jgi:hypothetical protein